MADILDFNDAAPIRVIDPKDFERRVEALRADLCARAEDFVRDIFPQARLQRDEARVGNLQGDAGESLSIGLTGDRTGLWFDHATGEGGDIIDLWRRSFGYGDGDFLKVVEDLERWAGRSSAPRWASTVHKIAEQRKSAARNAPPQVLGSPVGEWRYETPDGALIAVVRRYDLAGQLDEGGKPKKTFRPFLASGAPGMPDPRPLYRQADLIAAEQVILVEGEKCADALATLGMVATTAMGGASTNLGKTDWTPLCGKRVLIWPDNDAPGLSLPEKLRPHLEAAGASVAVLSIPPGRPAKWDAADAVAEGFDVAALLAGEPETIERPRARIPILSRADLRSLKRPEWLIDEVIPEVAVISIYGPSGSLKSFVAIDFSMCVVHGLPWHGRDVKQGPVIYVTGEGRDQISLRLDAWERAHEITDQDAPIFVVPVGIAISDPAWVEILIEEIKDACSAAPVMIWLDTLARTFGAGDENSQKDMNAFVTGMDRLRDEFRCVVGVVHHTGKEDSRGLRGSSALYAAMDTVIRTDRKAGKNTVALKNQQPHGKQKDAAEFDDIILDASIIDLGIQDSKGRPITSMALKIGVPVDEKVSMDPDPEAPQRRPQGALQQAIVTEIKRAKGRALGLVSLMAMVHRDRDTTEKSISALVGKGVIKPEGNGWILV